MGSMEKLLQSPKSSCVILYRKGTIFQTRNIQLHSFQVGVQSIQILSECLKYLQQGYMEFTQFICAE